MKELGIKIHKDKLRCFCLGFILFKYLGKAKNENGVRAKN